MLRYLRLFVALSMIMATIAATNKHLTTHGIRHGKTNASNRNHRQTKKATTRSVSFICVYTCASVNNCTSGPRTLNLTIDRPRGHVLVNGYAYRATFLARYVTWSVPPDARFSFDRYANDVAEIASSSRDIALDGGQGSQLYSGACTPALGR